MKALDWSAVRQNLDEFGSAPLGTVLTARECSEIVELYHDDGQFRSTIDMARHRFGEGQYRYFDYPLPSIVASLRETLWPQLLEIARDWADRLGRRPGRTSSPNGSWRATRRGKAARRR